MRLLTTFFLALFFFLGKGVSHQHSSSLPHSFNQFSSVKFASSISDVDASFEKKLVYTPDYSNSGEDSFASATELEDDEDSLSSSRKYVEIFNYFVAAYYAHIYEQASRFQKCPLPTCEHLSYLSSYKHIVHGVFRI